MATTSVSSGSSSVVPATSTTVAGTDVVSTPVITTSSAATTSAAVSSSSTGKAVATTTSGAKPTSQSGYDLQDFCNAFKNLQSSHYGGKNTNMAGVTFGTVSIIVSGKKYNSTLTLPIPPAPLPKSFIDRMMYNTTTIRAFEQAQIQVMADIAISVRQGQYVAGPGMTNTTNPGVPGQGTGHSAYGGLFTVYPPSNSSSVLSNYTSSPNSYNFTQADAGTSVAGLVNSGASSVMTFGLSTIVIVALTSFMMI